LLIDRTDQSQFETSSARRARQTQRTDARTGQQTKNNPEPIQLIKKKNETSEQPITIWKGWSLIVLIISTTLKE
jgi:hypothetical protein